ncbi:hypothetical protein EV363DRAFT_1401838 [Boletus edulis]|uniref:Secreted protein n=1 Tax=Boletus edulis BED1 TaxID=1328754 RepID=A0AAD4BH37_BOLED|nr:hypothetical protein EV363DRAFT_1401838 [Boletus edulis]KAF8428483.1 hypothetical protein L210DRAFT_3122360 [Boletus edulis BED1]
MITDLTLVVLIGHVTARVGRRTTQRSSRRSPTARQVHYTPPVEANCLIAPSHSRSVLGHWGAFNGPSRPHRLRLGRKGMASPCSADLSIRYGLNLLRRENNVM